MDKKYTIFILSAFFIFLLIMNGLGFADEDIQSNIQPVNAQNISDKIEWLIFSSTKYSHERNLVIKHERILPRHIKHGQIYIALEDLNSDGIKEIFAYIVNSYFCGTIGCSFNIYKIKNKKVVSLIRPIFAAGFPMNIELDNKGRQNKIGILTSKTMGWRDITIDENTIWSWKGKNYSIKKEKE
jgi:hypothetical protein